jgi:hypothetical protein
MQYCIVTIYVSSQNQQANLSVLLGDLLSGFNPGTIGGKKEINVFSFFFSFYFQQFNKK